MSKKTIIYIGTAGWAIPKAVKRTFTNVGTHLHKYSAVFSGVEINSTFYRSHPIQTYARWAGSVPDYFRFSIKIPKTITHILRLKEVNQLLNDFCSEIAGLKGKLGCLLVQLPPSLLFDAAVAQRFFESLRSRVSVDIACEPRNESWFEQTADRLLKKYKISRVAADPAVNSLAAVPGGYNSVNYFRLHGSPRMYYSKYTKSYLQKLAQNIRNSNAKRIYCYFDNTASNAAILNASELIQLLAAL